MKKWLGIALLLLSAFNSTASHIVGGEMIYDYLGNDKYKITLKIYRDCNVTSPFDGTGIAGPAYITVYDGFDNYIGVYDVGTPTITPVPPAFSNACIQVPHTTCIEEGIYIDT